MGMRKVRLSILRKIRKFLYSMKTAVVILVILVAVCTIGSLIPQGRAAAYYLTNYSENIGNFIITLGLNNTFMAWWFIILVVLLCLNLLFCSISRFPFIWKKYKNGYTLENRIKHQDFSAQMTGSTANAGQVLTQLRMKGIRQVEIDGSHYQYAVRRKFGLWGSWLCHLGMLVTILGFSVGQMFALDETVYGIPGEVKQVYGTDYEVQIDDFQIDLREDYTVEQYTSWLTVRDTGTGEEVSGTAKVNSPMGAFGLRLYQNSTGWASAVRAYKDDELITEKILYQGEALQLEELPLALYFAAFYPDYYNDGSGPQTLTPNLNNPQYVFALYYDNEMIAMNLVGPNEDIQVDSYRFVFQDPAQYTLIQVIHDPALAYAAFGGAIMLIGIFMAFYIVPEEIWIKTEGDGATLWCKSVKGSHLFVGKIERIFQGKGEDKNGSTAGS